MADWEWGGAARGGLSGASLGASIGGPWGAAIGGGLGALGGGLLGGTPDARKEQEALLEQLRKQAEEGDPMAREQLRQQTGRLMSMQQSMAAGADPGQQVAMSRIAAQNAARQQSAMAGQTALADILAKTSAQQQIAQLIGGMRQQDLQYPQPDFADYLGSAAGSLAQYQNLQGGGAGGGGGGQQAPMLGGGIGFGQPLRLGDTNLQLDPNIAQYYGYRPPLGGGAGA